MKLKPLREYERESSDAASVIAEVRRFFEIEQSDGARNFGRLPGDADEEEIRAIGLPRPSRRVLRTLLRMRKPFTR